MTLAYIHNGAIIRRYAENRGRVRFGNGNTVSPAVAGTYGDEALLPIVQETVDNSTSAYTVTERETIIEADRVVERVTISNEAVESVRQRLHGEVIRAYSEAMSPIGQQYPPEEREGWAEQVAAAQEVLAGGQNDLIDALRQPTGETATDMANKISAKRQEYLTAYAQATAARRALDAQIGAATMLVELEAVDVRATFGLT